jgi:hypothetical protein
VVRTPATFANTAIPRARPPAVHGIAPQSAERVRGHTLAAMVRSVTRLVFWTKEAIGVHGSGIARRALQGSCETGSPWSFVCAPRYSCRICSPYDTAATLVATQRLRKVNACTRRDASNRTNADQEGLSVTHKDRHKPAARACCPGGQMVHGVVSGLTPAEPRRPMPRASSQRRARLCPGAGERPPSGSLASRGERLAARAGAPAAASECLEQPSASLPTS